MIYLFVCLHHSNSTIYTEKLWKFSKMLKKMMAIEICMVFYSNSNFLIWNYNASSVGDQWLSPWFIWPSERTSLREKWLVGSFCALTRRDLDVQKRASVKVGLSKFHICMYVCMYKKERTSLIWNWVNCVVKQRRKGRAVTCVCITNLRGKTRAAGKNMLLKTGQYICYQMVASINQALLLWGGGKWQSIRVSGTNCFLHKVLAFCILEATLFYKVDFDAFSPSSLSSLIGPKPLTT